MRKLVFGVYGQVLHKLVCTVIEKDEKLEILNIGRRGLILTICVAKTKLLISCAVTAHLWLICYNTYVKGCERNR